MSLITQSSHRPLSLKDLLSSLTRPGFSAHPNLTSSLFSFLSHLCRLSSSSFPSSSTTLKHVDTTRLFVVRISVYHDFRLDTRWLVRYKESLPDLVGPLFPVEREKCFHKRWGSRQWRVTYVEKGGPGGSSMKNV